MSHLFFDAGSPPADGRKIMLATTSYDRPDTSYTVSIARSRGALHEEGLPTAHIILEGNCHVDDARNTVLGEFLRSDCTELVFLDADVSWDPEHLIKLCRFDCDIVGGVYPYRRETGKEGMPVRNLPGVVTPDENGLLEVAGLPAGFMRIRRHVLESMAEHAPHFRKSNGARLPCLFDRPTPDECEERYSGDINFCRLWRDMGGKVYAAVDFRLGHCGKVIIKDSLAASMRRQLGTTLRHVCDRLREGDSSPDLIAEAEKLIFNPWGAPPPVLSCAIIMARKSNGPILEIGSGLSTILMAAVSKERVWCLEHDRRYALDLEHMAASAGVGPKIMLVEAPLQNGWYFLGKEITALPPRFAFAFVDGPPRALGERMKFFDAFGDRCASIMIDDADEHDYFEKVKAWGESRGKILRTEGGRAAVLLPPEAIAEAAE